MIPGIEKEFQASAALVSSDSLARYKGEWGRVQAAHLLRRGLFGPSAAEITLSVKEGLDKTLDRLLADQLPPSPPLNFSATNDTNVPLGTTWVNAPPPTDSNNGHRRNSLVAWWMGLMIHQNMSLVEKMTLFWHNHFAIEMESVGDPRYVYRYLKLLRAEAMGNFKRLVDGITIDPAMLYYLNGVQNTRQSPNENYGRELFELFTIGKGPLKAEGDYTYYTEQDVKAAAKVLTGWRVIGQREGNIQVEFVGSRHDVSAKQFSAAFDNKIINNQGPIEYQTLIDMILSKKETARYICRKLYRWFVYYDISPEVEQAVIENMAQIFIDSGYEIKPVLRALLSSDHFYSPESIGCLIKNPIDHVVSGLRQLEVKLPDNTNIQNQYLAWLSFYAAAVQQDMYILDPPSVAGWPAYYQIPNFHQIWINSATLTARKQLVDGLVSGIRYRGMTFIVDPFTVVLKVSNPAEPTILVEELSNLLFPLPLSEKQLEELKDALIPGLPDYEWTIEYLTLVQNPNDKNLQKSVAAKLATMINAMLNMAEFHLS